MCLQKRFKKDLQGGLTPVRKYYDFGVKFIIERLFRDPAFVEEL